MNTLHNPVTLRTTLVRFTFVPFTFTSDATVTWCAVDRAAFEGVKMADSDDELFGDMGAVMAACEQAESVLAKVLCSSPCVELWAVLNHTAWR